MDRLTDCDWLALHIDALFEQDARGRLLRRRGPGGGSAPRFYLGRTLHGNQWRMRADLEGEVVRRLSRYAGKERPLPVGAGTPAPAERVEAMRGVLRDATPIVSEWRGPAYRFGESASTDHAVWSEMARGARLLEPGDRAARALLFGGFPELAASLAERAPCFAVVEEQEVQAVCYSACGRSGVVFEAGVETAEPHRGRGLAAKCVAAWALAVMRGGAVPLYSTEWNNPASRRVAAKLGLELYAEDMHLR